MLSASLELLMATLIMHYRGGPERAVRDVDGLRPLTFQKADRRLRDRVIGGEACLPILSHTGSFLRGTW
jgi:hypothetical protein